VAGVAALDYYASGFNRLGREFNIFLVPIFLSSLLFGLPLGILTWLLSFVTAYYCLIPPKYSFGIYSPKDLANLIGYFYLGLITLAIPVLIRASSAADAKR
jgi:K+-sensing histidine kinase KdpD